jgi:hypothetical protein
MILWILTPRNHLSRMKSTRRYVTAQNLGQAGGFLGGQAVCGDCAAAANKGKADQSSDTEH